MSKPRIKTYDRIIQESLKLFNEQGERNITTNHIAAHLGISPGNLYYHFRNKEEIVYQIFLMYRDFINQRLAVPEERDMTVADLVNYLDTAFWPCGSSASCSTTCRACWHAARSCSRNTTSSSIPN
jgi:AcrR family transcriptional regulator